MRTIGNRRIAVVVFDSARLVESVVAAEMIWEQTFDAIGEGILVYDAAKRIVRCNSRAAEMIEMSPEDVMCRFGVTRP